MITLLGIFNPAHCATLRRVVHWSLVVQYLYDHTLFLPCANLAAHTNYLGTVSCNHLGMIVGVVLVVLGLGGCWRLWLLEVVVVGLVVDLVVLDVVVV